MKKLYTLLISFILILSCSSLALAQDIDIDLSYEPYPAQPGDTIELEFDIENTESYELEDLVFKLKLEDEFTAVSSQQKTISSLDPDQSKTIQIEL